MVNVKFMSHVKFMSSCKLKKLTRNELPITPATVLGFLLFSLVIMSNISISRIDEMGRGVMQLTVT